MTARDPWVAIVRAAKAGRGVRLSADEVGQLADDDAIISAAESCLTECVCDIMRGGVSCERCTTTKPETEEARQAALASGRRIGKSINTAQQFSEEPRDTLDDAAKKRLARLWKRTRGAGKWTA